jgi:hypothetical protein
MRLFNVGPVPVTALVLGIVRAVRSLLEQVPVPRERLAHGILDTAESFSQRPITRKFCD